MKYKHKRSFKLAHAVPWGKDAETTDAFIRMAALFKDDMEISHEGSAVAFRIKCSGHRQELKLNPGQFLLMIPEYPRVYRVMDAEPFMSLYFPAD